VTAIEWPDGRWTLRDQGPDAPSLNRAGDEIRRQERLTVQQRVIGEVLERTRKLLGPLT